MPDGSPASVALVGVVAPSVEEAFYGLAGDIVRTIEPHSESDPWAILVQLLVAFGCVVGRKPYYQAEATRHYFRLNVLLVGETAKSRKGTAWGHVLRLLAQREMFDGSWPDRILRGLSSGEGLIWNVRDAIPENNDPGVTDKRLLVVEGEFAFPLETMQRPGNTLSMVIRDAWDGISPLATLTKISPGARATDAHVSIIGHITAEELEGKLGRLELVNGFANRFLFVWVRRSKVLPMGGTLSDEMLEPLKTRLREARTFARTVERIRFDTDAEAHWCDVYPSLSEGRPGLVGKVTARAEAHVVRLAGIYALLDRSQVIRLCHLRAALAVWRYAEVSAAHIFGDSTGDEIADALLREIRIRGDAGMTSTEIRDYFNGHYSREIDLALAMLEEGALVRHVREETGGRPATRWFATEATSRASPPTNPPDDAHVAA